MLFFALYFVMFICSLFKFRRSLHMLQQNLYNENNRYIKWITGDFLEEEPNQEIGFYEFDGYRFEYYGAYQKNQCIYLSAGGYIKSLNAFDLSRLQFNHNGNIFCYACDADGNIIEPKRVPIIYAKHSLVYCGIECMENFIIMNDADCDCNIGYLAIEKS